MASEGSVFICYKASFAPVTGTSSCCEWKRTRNDNGGHKDSKDGSIIRPFVCAHVQNQKGSSIRLKNGVASVKSTKVFVRISVKGISTIDEKSGV